MSFSRKPGDAARETSRAACIIVDARLGLRAGPAKHYSQRYGGFHAFTHAAWTHRAAAEVADVIAFLAVPDSGWITGQVLTVSGGMRF